MVHHDTKACTHEENNQASWTTARVGYIVFDPFGETMTLHVTAFLFPTWLEPLATLASEVQMFMSTDHRGCQHFKGLKVVRYQIMAALKYERYLPHCLHHTSLSVVHLTSLN
jgi:hypothetical protein